MMKGLPNQFQQSPKKQFNHHSPHNAFYKNIYSFSKADRFPKLRLPLHLSERHYSQPSEKQKKLIVSTIPRASRTFFSKQERQQYLNPSPQTYDLKLTDQIGKINHVGNTLGIRFSSSTKQITPGPLDYVVSRFSLQKSFNKTCTFKRQKRNIDIFIKKTGRDSPGPIYNTEMLFKKELPSKPKIKMQTSRKEKFNKKKKNDLTKRQRLQTKFLERQNNFLKSGQQTIQIIDNTTLRQHIKSKKGENSQQIMYKFTPID